MWIGYSSDFMRRVSRSQNFLVTETNAQGTGWSSRDQWPPYDGQLRQNMYAFLAGGANMVEYWHWATLHYGQETYWRGILGHDGKPNRVYREFAKGASELDQIGNHLVNLKKHNRVALLFSHDSKHALDFMPYTNGDQYKDYFLYEALYRQNIECDIVPVDREEMQDFSQYDLLVVPPLYVATDRLLRKISEFVARGGEVVMMYKSGYTDQDNVVRTEIAPGPLRDACGFDYQEYSSINRLRLKENKTGSDGTVSTWMEFLRPTTAVPLAVVDHGFFSQWPCITENEYGKGHLIYVGALPTQDILQKLIARAADRKGIAKAERECSFPIILRSGTNDLGKRIHYVFNYSSEAKTVKYPFGKSTSLLDGQTIHKNDEVSIEPWGVLIGEE